MIDVGIATSNRPAIAASVVADLRTRQERPAPVLVSIARDQDFDRSQATSPGPLLTVIDSARGLSAQRNAILDASAADILIFIDDDFLPAPDYVAEVEKLFSDNPDIVVATGKLLADGARTGGMEFDEGLRILDAAGPNVGGAPTPTYGAYGCNMVIRMAPMREHGLRFDENLPLYGWQEDIDFSRQLAPFGRIVQSPRLRGVHLGTKRSGRSPGRQLGYSQVANPFYLVRKGTMSREFAWRLVKNNVGGNVLRFLRPEPNVDRRGRLKGNLLALRDILIGQCDPRRILEL